jgi:hypothetical protein
VKLFGAQRRRDTAKPLQFLELMKAKFDCSGNNAAISGREASRRKFTGPKKGRFPEADDAVLAFFPQERRKTRLFVSYDLLREKAMKKARSLNISQSCGVGTTICQKKCCISNALDGSVDVILWEDDVEDKDDGDWV